MERYGAYTARVLICVLVWHRDDWRSLPGLAADIVLLAGLHILVDHIRHAAGRSLAAGSLAVVGSHRHRLDLDSMTCWRNLDWSV